MTRQMEIHGTTTLDGILMTFLILVVVTRRPGTALRVMAAKLLKSILVSF